jgi:hypothetical protein
VDSRPVTGNEQGVVCVNIIEGGGVGDIKKLPIVIIIEIVGRNHKAQAAGCITGKFIVKGIGRGQIATARSGYAGARADWDGVLGKTVCSANGKGCLWILAHGAASSGLCIGGMDS